MLHLCLRNMWLLGTLLFVTYYQNISQLPKLFPLRRSQADLQSEKILGVFKCPRHFYAVDTASVQSFVSRCSCVSCMVLPLSRCLWRDLSLQAKLVRDLLFALQAGSTVQKPYMHWQWLAQVGQIDKSWENHEPSREKPWRAMKASKLVWNWSSWNGDVSQQY